MTDAVLVSVLDVTDQPVVIFDAKGQVTHTNQAACDTLGISVQGIEGLRIDSLFTDLSGKAFSDLESFLDTLQNVANTLHTANLKQPVSPVLTCVPHCDSAVPTTYILKLSGESDNASPASSKYASTLLDTVLDGLITIDQKGHIQAFNQSAERIFGYRAAEVRGKNVNVLMPAPYHDEHDQYLRNYQGTGEKKVIGIGREVKARRKDGTVFPIELGVNELIEGEKVTYVGTIRDISERHAAEKEIQNYISALKVSNEELDQFAYIASHDLKEPLRGLSNNAMFLEEDYQEQLDDAGRKRLARMRFLCTRMEGLVSSLLYYSRLGRQELAVERKQLADIIRDVTDITLPEDLSDVELVLHTPLPDVYCDVPRTTELFRNLISNALKYNQSPTKRIEIGADTLRNPVTDNMDEVFFVKDNGIGIDGRFFDDIFKIFKRLNEEDDNVRGTGVGLTYVKKIVERHKGHIWVESAPGQGSTFFFTFGLKEEQ